MKLYLREIYIIIKTNVKNNSKIYALFKSIYFLSNQISTSSDIHNFHFTAVILQILVSVMHVYSKIISFAILPAALGARPRSTSKKTEKMPINRLEVEKQNSKKNFGYSTRCEFGAKLGQGILTLQVMCQFFTKFGVALKFSVQGLRQLGLQDQILWFSVLRARFQILGLGFECSIFCSNVDFFRW